MKIGLVLASTPGYSETFFRSKIKGLMDAEHQIVLFCVENPHNFDLCPVVLLSRHHRNIFKQIRALILVYLGLLPYPKSVIRFIKLELLDGNGWSNIFKRIYTHAPVFKQDLDWLHFGFGTLALGCENLAAANNAKMAVSFRGFDIGVYPIKYPNCYERLWNKVSKIHVISDDIAKLVYVHGCRDQVPLIKITPAIDAHYFVAPHRDSIKIPLQIVTVARLHWKKGLDYTLEALALLKQSGVAFTYRIIGVGPEEESLKFACYQLGLEDNVRFLGKLNVVAVRQELSTSDVYVQYSVQEGFCNAVLEAQAMGLLCVVSDAEGLGENVHDGYSGWVVPMRAPGLLAKKLIDIIELPLEDKKEFQIAAIERIQSKFNLKLQRQAFMDFYSR
jgi:colanic acid/amylovoran biosynthesis glycosyltransferase